MRELKKVPFKWGFREETASLCVDSYYYGNGMLIEIIHYEDDEPDLFADMTINLPGYTLAPNEAAIDGDISKDILKFIKEQKLGTVLPYTLKSGMAKYSVVAFDLDRLREFDPEGVDKYKALRGIN